jgi:hypothetical protein
VRRGGVCRKKKDSQCLRICSIIDECKRRLMYMRFCGSLAYSNVRKFEAIAHQTVHKGSACPMVQRSY